MSQLPEAQETSTDVSKLNFEEILNANGITDRVSEVIVKESGLREGFVSLQQYVTIKFENPNIKPLNLFAKTHTGNVSHSEMVDGLKAFEKETRFFREYVPAAKELCKSKGQEGLLDIYPKYYYGDDKIIILENLMMDKGYILLPKEEKQDLEAATCAIKTLAKHHAISHAMIQVYGGHQKFFQKFKNLDFDSFTAPAFERMIIAAMENNINTYVLLLESNNIEGGEEALAKTKVFLNGKSFKLVQEAICSLTNDEFALLCHGDYWNNNMMFKMDPETNKVVGHIAIDFQVTRYNSPALDLLYYLFTSLKPDIRRDHLKSLLTLYLETLQKTSMDLDHPIDLAYEELFLAFRKKLNYGFLFSLCFGPAMQVMSEFDLSEVDMSDMPKVIYKMVQDWLAKNLEVGKAMAVDFVKVLKEYEELKLD